MDTTEKDQTDLEKIAGQTADSAKIIKEKFGQVADEKAEEARRLYQERRKFEVVEILWRELPQNASGDVPAPIAINSASQAIRAFAEYVGPIQTEEFNKRYISTISASGDSIAGMTLPVFGTVRSFIPPEAKSILTGDALTQRKVVESKLPLEISKEFSAAWQTFESGNADPERGATFYMREAVTHTLAYFAPDEEVKACDWFIPDPNSKTGIKRKHRIKFIVRRYYEPLEWAHREELLNGLVETYHDLCSAHKRGTFERETIESYMNNATGLLHSFLSDSGAKNR